MLEMLEVRACDMDHKVDWVGCVDVSIGEEVALYLHQLATKGNHHCLQRTHLKHLPKEP
jgi:hypothetical protein